MPDNDRDFLSWATGPSPETQKAPHKLKARLYSALIEAQQESGPLRDLVETKSAGHGLCFFEELVRIAPVPNTVKQPFVCWSCHARVLAENLEHAPIWWPNCPYSDFQK